MEITIFHLFKVFICSAVLFGYYLLVLKDKKFHHFNRFYLLAAVVVSWVIPLVEIELQHQIGTTSTFSYQLAETIADGNSSFENMSFEVEAGLDWHLLFNFLMAIVSFIIATGVLRSIYKIFMLIKTSPAEQINSYILVYTDAKGTPFSFFSYIFWNRSIAPQSSIGKQMLAHESVHANQKHSADKLFIELMMIAGWFNPIFWLLKKELYLIHEYIADSKAIENQDSSLLAELLLTAAYPRHLNRIVHPFFFSPIKRRINMLKKINTIRFSYFRRIIVLPIVALLLLLFAFRNTEQLATAAAIENEYVVILDAGHGGHDHGVQSSGGEAEAELALELVRQIKAMNKNPLIRFELSRDKDEYVKLQDRTQFSVDRKANLFVSVHLNGSPDKERRGLEIYCPKEGSHGYIQSLPLASIVEQSLTGIFTSSAVKTRKKHSIWVLDKSMVPAILIESGYLSNAQDLGLFKSKKEEIAKGIIKGIEQYLAQQEKGGS